MGLSNLWSTLNKPSARYSLLALTAGGFITGIIFWGGFNTVMEATNTMEFCTGCHEMRDNVYAEYRHTIHYQNRTGVKATCSDCHVPKDWTHKMIRKVQASNEVYHWILGSVNTKEKFDAKRPILARHVWDSMKASDSRECRNCHTLESMNPEFQKPRARKVHMDAMQAGNTCIDCHKGIAHKNVRNTLTDEELEQLEKPVADYIRAVPQTYKDGLERVAKREAEEAEKKKVADAAAESAIQTRIAQAVAAAGGKAATPAAAAAASVAPAASGAAPASGAASKIDWSGIPATDVALFYPGQASFEWVQTPKDHGGARAFIKAGDRCSTCHAKEVKDIGTKILAGGHAAEPAPIPGKRPFIEMKVQASHDNDSLSMRFEWKNGPHSPFPGAEGGKLDAKNQVKLAMMIAGTGIERVDQAGCWATCHTDSRSMPDAAKVDPSKIASLTQDADMKSGLTKYLAESRSEMDVKGSGDVRGGGDKVKSSADIEALAKTGSFMDMIRVRSAEPAENGMVLGQRQMKAGAAIEGSAILNGDTWVATFTRKLKGEAGDVSIEPGKVYTVGFAIHDDWTNTRYHHVSFDWRLALDAGDAEIIAKKR